MRCKDIKVKFEIPVKVNEPDANGIVYTEEAIENACQGVLQVLPIISYNSAGESVVIGTTTKVEYKDGIIFVEGQAWFGGTEEEIDIEDGMIKSMKIVGFGICD